MDNVAYQTELRPALPNVYGTKDYREFREIIIRIDRILNQGGLEHSIVSGALDAFVNDNNIDAADFNSTGHYKIFRHALRCNIARHLTGESYRSFSIRLSDSTLLQWFDVATLTRTDNL